MKLNELVKISDRRKKRLGRGIGSGLGKTSGRGTKGQKARGKMSVGFTGAGLPTYKKLPLRRGLGNRVVSLKPKILDLSKLSIFKTNSIIDLETLLESKLITKKDVKQGVKILASKTTKSESIKKLIVKLSVSKQAKQEIDKMGGRVEYV